MAFYSHFLRDVQQILFRDRDQHAIPSMDGAYSPNDLLDRCELIGDPIASPDDIVAGPDGAIYVSTGNEVLRLAGVAYRDRSVFAKLPGKAGGLAFHPDGRLLICVAGQGLVAIDSAGHQTWLRALAQQPLNCLTSVAAAPNGVIFLSNGSSRHAPDAWLVDLMENNSLGSLLVCDAQLREGEVLLGGLRYPHGLAISRGGREVWFTESWSHRLSRAAILGRKIGTPQVMIGNLPGYPARLGRAADSGFWLSLFGLRTHLIELVLREDKFRGDMMRSVDPALWVGPSLATTGSYLEPLQSGNVKKLGIHKPWAPARSYGLVVHIDEEGEPVRSLHSRVGGSCHGVTGAVETEQGLVIVSKGHNRVALERPESGA